MARWKRGPQRGAAFAATTATAATIIPVDALPAFPIETPVEKVHRIAKELSLAMDDWMADLGGDKDAFVAEIHPSKAREFPIGFRHNLGGWHPHGELILLSLQFQELEIKCLAAREMCHDVVCDFEKKFGEDRDRVPFDKWEPYWAQ
ncbi:hypothetical protein [Mesorhizobium sp.]|uniref:hypothetical protein n=1 Tax=Mesorhizobium sp. TaxID=1871066 RepID=UPI000FE4F620|nr:hypothetical protein [Mesorhizobium sp.]RWA59455.1 MAG: hypothetical protein EOQ27_26410 [Mesorhizobium sp.]